MPSIASAIVKDMTIKPANRIRRFDVFAEYRKQDEHEGGMPADQAKGYGLWVAKVVAARKFGRLKDRDNPARPRRNDADDASGASSVASRKPIACSTIRSSSEWARISIRKSSFQRYATSASWATRTSPSAIGSVGAGSLSVTIMPVPDQTNLVVLLCGRRKNTSPRHERQR